MYIAQFPKAIRFAFTALVWSCKVLLPFEMFIKNEFSTCAAHSQDFGEFDFIDLLSIFNSRDHPLGVAVC